MTLPPADDSRQRQALGWLIAIVIAFVALQSWNLTFRWVDDESWYTMPIPSVSQGQFNIPTVPGDDRFWPQPPILTYLATLVEAVSGPITPALARSVPLAFGVLTIVAAFALGRRLGGPLAGSLAAAFVAFDNLVFLAARTVRPEMLVAFFLLWTLTLLVPLLQGQAWRWRQALGVSVVAALGLYSHPNGLMIPMTVVVLVLLSGAMQRRLAFTAAFCVLYGLVMLPFVAWIAYYDMASGFESFRGHWFKRYARQAGGGSRWDVLVRLLTDEVGGRYRDFMQFPYRVHIAVLSVAVVVAGLFTRRPGLRALAVAVLLQLLFFLFVNNSNPTVRYMTTTTPVIAVLAALWAAALWSAAPSLRPMRHRLAAAVLVLAFGVMAAAGNAVYIWKFRHADFLATSARVNTLIPAGSVVYGGMFWWPQMRQHTLVPYIRTPWPAAVERWKPNIVIMDDWVMAGGGEGGAWLRLRSELDTYLASHGRLLGEVDGGFYGRLRVFEVRH